MPRTPLSRRQFLGGSLALAAFPGSFDFATVVPGPEVTTGQPVRVGVWYEPWWDGGPWTNHIKPPLLGVYVGRDPKIIAAHLRMMRECGIDFIIFDQTNTIFVNNSVLDHTVRAWYDAMDALPASERIELCIAFGGELNQHHNYTTFLQAADYLYKNYATRPSQMKVDGKPLVLWQISEENLPDWHDDRWTIKHSFPFQQMSNQAKWGGWGWGSHPFAEPNKECMSIKPGWHLAPAAATGRNFGYHYMGHWLNVLKTKPRFITICDWNNFTEETAIEDSEEWTDYYGTPTPDWYRQITKQYTDILRTGRLTSGAYYEDEKSGEIWQSSMRQLTLQRAKPHGAPVLLLPHGWLDNIPKRAAPTYG